MKASLRLLNASKARTPLIHFLGPRKTPTEPHVHRPHVMAPPEAKGEAFEAFLQKLNSSDSASASTASTKAATYRNFWEVPHYASFRPPELSELEIEEIMASFGLHCNLRMLMD
ncbi:hypothetical protein FRC04_003955 [Tulasnella sp. 424]|nr:hypothetical protein FRC04_003955 [Tulasnella sp. 424]KAG8965191.1 hypothetical protein FRC05_003334 [Tulasnella sp. 425]